VKRTEEGDGWADEDLSSSIVSVFLFSFFFVSIGIIVEGSQSVEEGPGDLLVSSVHRHEKEYLAHIMSS